MLNMGKNNLRGGSRNVEGCWGFPYLKITKFVGFIKLPFHVFDRYEIHMETLFNQFPLFPDPPLHICDKNDVFKIYKNVLSINQKNDLHLWETKWNQCILMNVIWVCAQHKNNEAHLLNHCALCSTGCGSIRKHAYMFRLSQSAQRWIDDQSLIHIQKIMHWKTQRMAL